MATSIKSYYDQLIIEKQTFSSLSALQPSIDDSQTLLSDLTSTTKVSRWRLILWLMAFAMWLHETVLENLVALGILGTVIWYRKIALEFQYGDALEIINGVPQYPTVNLANRIVKLSAVVETSQGGMIIKVAKLNSGTVAPLVTAEKAAFEAYINLKKFAGPQIIIVSQNGDDLKIRYRIYYDPQLMNLDGSLISDSSVFPVYNAINDFLKDQNLKDFNGVLHLDRLTDAVQKAVGVKHAVLVEAYAKPWYENVGAYVNITGINSQSYNPEAGHLKISGAAGETLVDLTQYVAA